MGWIAIGAWLPTVGQPVHPTDLLAHIKDADVLAKNSPDGSRGRRVGPHDGGAGRRLVQCRGTHGRTVAAIAVAVTI
jgi:hypothetical protein